MSNSTNEPSSGTPVKDGRGLAITSLVLGILAICSSCLFIGIVFGIIGLILGIIDLTKRGRCIPMTGWGVGLSLLGVIASLGFGIATYMAFQHVKSSLGQNIEVLEQESEWVGKAAPDLTLTTLDGQTITLGELKGKRVILAFWATWCPPCREEIPHFIQLAKEVSNDDLVIIGISKEKEAVLKNFVEKEGINYPIVSADPDPPPYSEVSSIPTTFFIDRNGMIQKVLVGYHDFETLKQHALEADYEAATNSLPATVPEAIHQPEEN